MACQINIVDEQHENQYVNTMDDNVFEKNHMDIYIAGEQLRASMHAEGSLIAQRQQQTITFNVCFVGFETVEWLVKARHVDSRRSGVKLLRILGDNNIIHHVTDQQSFFDDNNLYRFRRDDATFSKFDDLSVFFKGLKLYSRLVTEPNRVLRVHEENGVSYENSFSGQGLLDWMVIEHMVMNRHQALTDCRSLLASNVIHHVTHQHHLKDDNLLYQFSVNLKKHIRHSDIVSRYSLRGTLNFKELDGASETRTTESTLRKISQISLGSFLFSSDNGNEPAARKNSQSPDSRQTRMFPSPERTQSVPPQRRTRKLSLPENLVAPEGERRRKISAMPSFPFFNYQQAGSARFAFPKSASARNIECYSSCGDESDGDDYSTDDTEEGETDKFPSTVPTRKARTKGSVLPKYVMKIVSAQELESSSTLYLKKNIKIISDSVGYGFVIRGDGPTFVQTVDPKGPGYEAGLRVKQYLYEVNGEKVVQLPHQQVAKQVINSSMGVVNITVMIRL
ncbi:PREDICTED: DEP domain-containing mTOR-interacting protein-like isoform X1 [Priapulus caudatus]|uniref:DEP domain-containing mTOR-interacting protein-like isoform X1 n=1 Tax=Priapulus caudatus TaxID=37621 RepID=A0ABM1EQU3_PRICU|nr:PREDICTED: DEP domain-containing mTOR-interacting protein-like isoform X1 [Priapulus caudatus]